MRATSFSDGYRHDCRRLSRLIILSTVLISTTAMIANAQTRVRKDVTALTTTELDNYIHALDILRQRSTKDPLDKKGYVWWAALHNDSEVGPCEHGSDRFFAWHRAHLSYFEDLLRASDPPRTADVTIPYWDFMRPGQQKFPAQFSKPGLKDVRSNAAAAPPADTLEIVKTVTTWPEFGGGRTSGSFGDLEFGPHNDMHGRYIGGKMADPTTAAEDPIYWSFHSYLDLLWSEWQRRNPTEKGTSPEVKLRGFLTMPKFQITDFQSIATLGYSYELNPDLEKALEISGKETTAARQPERVTATLTPTAAPKVVGNVQMVQYALPAEAKASDQAPLVLNFAGVSIPQRDNLTMKVFVHPKGVTPNPDSAAFVKQYYVGYKAFWKSPKSATEKGHHPATADVRVTVNRPNVGPDSVVTLVIARSVAATGAEAGAAPERLTFGAATAEIPR